MHMQVPVNPENRKFLRFLWGVEETEFFEYTRFVFGAKYSPTCAICALRTCADDNAESHPHVKKLVYENFYLDDFFEATSDIDTAVKFIEDLRHVQQLGSFNLTKWITTYHWIVQTIPEEHESIFVDEIKDLKIFKRVLGIRWK